MTLHQLHHWLHGVSGEHAFAGALILLALIGLSNLIKSRG